MDEKSKKAEIVSIEPEILTAGELAKRYRCTPQTIGNLARKGVIPGIQFGRRWLFKRHEVEQVWQVKMSA